MQSALTVITACEIELITSAYMSACEGFFYLPQPVQLFG